MNEAHPLAPLLSPGSVAIFGASNDPGRISGRSLRYYKEAGYRGALYPINPNTVQIRRGAAVCSMNYISQPTAYCGSGA